MAFEKRIGIKIPMGSVFILVLVLMYLGRLGTAAPLLSVDFPIWSVTTSAYRIISQAIAFLVLSVMGLDTSFSTELMPLDALVDVIPFVLLFLGLAFWGRSTDAAQSRRALYARSPVRRTLEMTLLFVLALGFFGWGFFTAVQFPLAPIGSLEALKDVFPFWSPASHRASMLTPSELLEKLVFHAALLIVGLIGMLGSLSLQKRSFPGFLVVLFIFNSLAIWGGIFAFSLISAFFIQMNQFTDLTLPAIERIASAFAAWLEAAGW